MKVLVVGQGGREHALCRALIQRGQHPVWVAPGNPGAWAEGARRVDDISGQDPDAVVSFCKQNGIELVVIGPEDELARGLADALAAQDIPVFGPQKFWARLESSKSYAKEFMRNFGVATAASTTCFTRGQVLQAAGVFRGQCALKFDGLAAGKGVSVCLSMEDVHREYDAIVAKLGIHPEPIFVVEELLVGWEMSVIALCDGQSLCYFPPVADHKRLYNSDQGPNTGGMGVFSPVKRCTPSIWQQFQEHIAEPTLRGLKDQAAARPGLLPYRGALFFGVMVTEKGPKLLEYNCRFGDPETQAICALVDSGFTESLWLCTQGRLKEAPLKIATDQAAVGVVMTTAQYPNASAAPLPFTQVPPDPQQAAQDNLFVFHSGTRLLNETLHAAGGRIVTVTARGSNVTEARKKSYDLVSKITFPGAHFRTDIGENQ